MFKIAICDDERLYRTLLKNEILSLYTGQDTLYFYEYESGDQLLNSDMEEVDLLFLDIQMPGIDGNAASYEFRKVNQKAILIFCTNYHVPTVENIKAQPFRYIVKDLQNKMLKEELPDILDKLMKDHQDEKLTVTIDGNVFRIPMAEIIYLIVDDRKTKIVYDHQKQVRYIWCREKLKELYPLLDHSEFEYAHNSYIVHLSQIMRIEKKVLTMSNNEILGISRSKAKQFDAAFSRYLSREYRRK